MKVVPGETWKYRDGSTWTIRSSGILECTDHVPNQSAYKRGSVNAKPELIDIRDGWTLLHGRSQPILSFRTTVFVREIDEDGWHEFNWDRSSSG